MGEWIVGPENDPQRRLWSDRELREVMIIDDPVYDPPREPSPELRERMAEWWESYRRERRGHV